MIGPNPASEPAPLAPLVALAAGGIIAFFASYLLGPFGLVVVLATLVWLLVVRGQDAVSVRTARNAFIGAGIGFLLALGFVLTLGAMS